MKPLRCQRACQPITHKVLCATEAPALSGFDSSAAIPIHPVINDFRSCSIHSSTGYRKWPTQLQHLHMHGALLSCSSILNIRPQIIIVLSSNGL